MIQSSELMARRDTLTVEQESLMAQILQAQHRVSEYGGAINELNSWIEKLKAEESHGENEEEGQVWREEEVLGVK